MACGKRPLMGNHAPDMAHAQATTLNEYTTIDVPNQWMHQTPTTMVRLSDAPSYLRSAPRRMGPFRMAGLEQSWHAASNLRLGELI
jgi:hypothetical protein